MVDKEFFQLLVAGWKLLEYSCLPSEGGAGGFASDLINTLLNSFGDSNNENMVKSFNKKREHTKKNTKYNIIIIKMKTYLDTYIIALSGLGFSLLKNILLICLTK